MERFRRHPILNGIALAVFLTLIVGTFTDVFSTTDYTCLECRAVLHKRRVFGVPFDRVDPGALSEIVLSRNPAHQHAWRWSGTVFRYRVTSTSREGGQQHPIWKIPPSVQAEYARSIPAAELQATIQEIDSGDPAVSQAGVDRLFERVVNSR